MPNGEEALVGLGAWGPFPFLDVLAGGQAECLDGVVVLVHVGWQCLLVGISDGAVMREGGTRTPFSALTSGYPLSPNLRVSSQR